MSAIGLIMLAIVAAGTTLELYLLIRFRPYQPSRERAKKSPMVSVLVAMRNERHTAERCINALLDQEYEGEYEILAGDDMSADGTFELLTELARDQPKLRVIRVLDTRGSARGKGNVLDHLRDHARGEVLLITDADVAVNGKWIRTMASGWEEETGVVNGLTEVEGNNFQHLEWLHAQTMLHVMHSTRAVTAIGNNMGMRASAYDETGGYSKLPFSLTEDRAITHAIVDKGYKLQSRICSESLVTTLAMDSFQSLISQRRRWMTGAVQLPWWIVAGLGIQACYYPALIVLCVADPVTGLLLAALKAVFQDSLVSRINRNCRVKVSPIARLCFEPYMGLMAWVHIAIYLMPGRVRWKSREFRKEYPDLRTTGMSRKTNQGPLL